MTPYDPDFLSIEFPYRDSVSSAELAEVIRDGLGRIWTGTTDGETDRLRYIGPATDYDDTWSDVDTAIEQFTRRDGGRLTLFDGDVEYALETHRSPETGGTDSIPGLTLSVPMLHFGDDTDASREDVVTPLVDAVTFLYDALPIPFVCSRLPTSSEHEIDVTPADVRAGRLPDVFWLMVVPAGQAAAVGRTRLTDYPRGRVEPLDDGSVCIVATEHPWAYTETEQAALRAASGIGLDDTGPASSLGEPGPFTRLWTLAEALDEVDPGRLVNAVLDAMGEQLLAYDDVVQLTADLETLDEAAVTGLETLVRSLAESPVAVETLLFDADIAARFQRSAFPDVLGLYRSRPLAEIDAVLADGSTVQTVCGARADTTEFLAYLSNQLASRAEEGLTGPHYVVAEDLDSRARAFLDDTEAELLPPAEIDSP